MEPIYATGKPDRQSVQLRAATDVGTRMTGEAITDSTRQFQDRYAYRQHFVQPPISTAPYATVAWHIRRISVTLCTLADAAIARSQTQKSHPD